MYGNLHDCALELKLNEYKSAREDSMFYQAVSVFGWLRVLQITSSIPKFGICCIFSKEAKNRLNYFQIYQIWAFYDILVLSGSDR